MGPRAIEPQAYVIVVARATGQAHGFVGLPTNNPCANGHSDIIQELMGKLAHGLAGPPRLSTQGPNTMGPGTCPLTSPQAHAKHIIHPTIGRPQP